MSDQDKKFIYDFIHNQKISVISSLHPNNTPESAVVEFAETEDLEIIFDTLHPSYRKYANIKNNPAVSFVIGWDEDKTVQYEGIAKEVEGPEKETAKKIYFQKNPEAEKWDKNPEIKYFIVKPKWVRYSDYSQSPYKIITLNF